MATLTKDIIRAIVRGEHGDPFAVLGPHVITQRGQGAVAIRAFFPGAEKVTVLPTESDRPPRPMVRIHADGLFEVVFPKDEVVFTYRLEVMGGGGGRRIEDPYRFPSTLSDFDLLLIGEGKHYRSYEKLGAHLLTLDGVYSLPEMLFAPFHRAERSRGS